MWVGVRLRELGYGLLRGKVLELFRDLREIDEWAYSKE